MRKNVLTKLFAGTLALATVIGVAPYAASASGYVPAVQTWKGEGQASVKYVTMNVPYTDFYAAYELTDKAVWEVETGVDAVSTATTSKFSGTTGLAKGTYNNGKYIMGVTIPVAVSAEDYAKLDSVDASTEDGAKKNYAYTDLAEAPKAYSTLTIGADGKKSFSKIQDSAIDTSQLSITELVTTGSYGDYQITLNGFGTEESKVKTGADTSEEFTIYGAVLNIDDKTYGMTCLENIWVGTKAPNAEIAWSIKNGGQKSRAHGKGGLFYQFDHNGGTLSKIDVITNLGIISVGKVDLDGKGSSTLSEYYPGDLSGLKLSLDNDSDVLNVSGIPGDITNPKVSVAYAQGRNSVSVAEKAEVKDEKVTLSEKSVAGATYTVAISSDNYSDIVKTLSTPITEAQKTELRSLADQAKATTGYDSNADLKQHVSEAEDLISKTDAASVDAAELISELKEKIKNTYPAVTISDISLKGSVLTIGLQEELSTLGNPTYTLTSGSGRAVTTLASGNLTELSITLAEAPAIGTEYTLTIVSDNYKDTTASVTAEEAAPPAAEDPAPQTTKKAAVITVKTTSKTLKASKLKKKAQTFSIGASADSKGKLTYSRVSGSKKLTVNKTTGKITVKKNTKKGSYQIKVKVKAAANGDYKAAAVTTTIKVKIK